MTRAVQQGTDEYWATIRDLDAIAGQLKRLRDAGVPVLWRPLHEADGGWFWWGAKGPEATKQLYYMMRDRFINYHGLNNLIWVWSVDKPNGSWYPGNDHVDILGIDSYPGGYNYDCQKSKFNDLGNMSGW